MLTWLRTTYRRATPCADRSFEELRLLVMDAFSAHLTEEVRDEMKKMRIAGSYIPGGCTGYVQPLNVALNQPLKQLIKESLDCHYDEHEKEYEAGKFRTVENWQWFVAGGAPQDFVPEILEGGRGQEFRKERTAALLYSARGRGRCIRCV